MLWRLIKTYLAPYKGPIVIVVVLPTLSVATTVSVHDASRRLGDDTEP